MRELVSDNIVTWNGWNVTGFDVGIPADFAILSPENMKEVSFMTVLEVKNLKKIYRTRFGGDSGAGSLLREFFCGGRRVCGDHG